MKAFLSHSSKDAALVHQVAKLVGGANVELDDITFDRGLLNVEAIYQALRRASIFVLFLTTDALVSGIVKFETLLARELLARSIIDRFLVICLDENAFGEAEKFWKDFNFVRKATAPEPIARLIQHLLVITKSNSSSLSQPFVGRGKELDDAKGRLAEPSLAELRAIYISGNAGIGRRTFARHLYHDVYPAVNPLFPEISVDDLDGYEELYRKLLQIVTPTSTLSALRTRVLAFDVADTEGKVSQIASLLETLLRSREAVIVHDHGGLLAADAGFQPAIKHVLQKAATFPHPPIIFIADRMMPKRRRGDVKGIVYVALPALTESDVRQLAGLLLRNASIRYTNEELDKLVDLADGHPFNVRFMIEAASQYTLPVFLADPSDLIQWKRRRASDFIQKIDFLTEESLILIALRDFKTLDFNLLSQVAAAPMEVVGKALTRLIELHIVEGTGDTYTISPPLRIAVEKDGRFSPDNDTRRKLFNIVSDYLNISSDDTSVSISMVDAGIIASLRSGRDISNLFTAFLLPSHYVWLARRYYHEGKFADCISLTRLALEGLSRLSPGGRMEACRWLCLAASRLNQEPNFEFGIAIAIREAKDDRSRSNTNFLYGFHARMNGNLPEAEVFFRKAIEQHPGNHSAVRELASICLIRGNSDEAETLARSAIVYAPDNPYILDILLNSIISSSSFAKDRANHEIDLLFERLSRIGHEDGQSFYTTCRARYEYRLGNLPNARKMIDEAVSRTPWLFDVHALRAEIYLDSGNRIVVEEILKNLRDMVYRNQSNERRWNLRAFLQLEVKYYRAIGNYDEAIKIYDDDGVFTKEDKDVAKKQIDIERAYLARRNQ